MQFKIINYNIIFLIIVVILLGAGFIWLLIPRMVPWYMIRDSTICEFVIRGCRSVDDIPPIENMQVKFPNGYQTAIRICKWPIYSKIEKIFAINTLAWYIIVGDDVIAAECIDAIRVLEKNNEYASHCQYIFNLIPIKDRLIKLSEN